MVGHNPFFTTNSYKYWVGTCPSAPLVPTGLKITGVQIFKYTQKLKMKEFCMKIAYIIKFNFFQNLWEENYHCRNL